MMPAARRERINNLKQLIEGYAATNRVIISDLTNPQRTEAEIDRCEKLAAMYARQAEEARSRLVDGADNIAANQKHIERLRREISTLENQDKIDKLAELLKAVNQ